MKKVLLAILILLSISLLSGCSKATNLTSAKNNIKGEVPNSSIKDKAEASPSENTTSSMESINSSMDNLNDALNNADDSNDIKDTETLINGMN